MGLLPVVGGAALVALVALAVLLRAVLSVVVVSGPSMSPALRPGQRVLVLRRGPARLRAGRIVVVAPDGLGAPGFGTPRLGTPGLAAPGGGRARRQPDRLLVKRLVALPGDPVPQPVRPVVPGGTVPGGHVVLLGDNPGFSTDSRMWGAIPARSVVGVVLDGVRLWS
ncbi:S26 family signal peptidase [Kitasatospora sp. NPDC097691]|uniref:S26 family signal peptidase n=1 Tax=Kitasatospora sp. NPDC097691 TaxID=3157231 RepID=UPI0033248EA6